MDSDTLSKVTALYIEDDIQIADAYAKALERRVKTLYRANNGEEGLDIYNKKSPDMIITDINMPKMNGLKMIETIRETNLKIPIIITSAHGESTNLLEAINIGVDGYLLKPVDRDKLFALMNNCAKIILYEREMIFKAYKDGLTKANNREKFDILLDQLFKEQQKAQMPLSLMILDIDHFKDFNDTYGHQEGDKILKEFAQVISSHVRDNDIFARWGGEEFVVLTTAPIGHIYSMAENLRKLIQEYLFSDKYKVQCSIGMTSMLECDTTELFFKRADKALYKAKNSGRNRVEIL